MRFLNLFSRSMSWGLVGMPRGSFTVDRHGRVLSSTLPQNFPAHCLQEIGETILSAFHSARQIDMPLTEFVVDYASLRITARDLSGGMIVFLSPRDGMTRSAS